MQSVTRDTVIDLYPLSLLFETYYSLSKQNWIMFPDGWSIVQHLLVLLMISRYLSLAFPCNVLTLLKPYWFYFFVILRICILDVTLVLNIEFMMFTLFWTVSTLYLNNCGLSDKIYAYIWLKENCMNGENKVIVFSVWRQESLGSAFLVTHSGPWTCNIWTRELLPWTISSLF